VAKWDRGNLVSGNYFFYDNLPYENENWEYSTQRDRSFYTEVLKGIRPDGKTLLVNNIEGPRLIPTGTYDIGDGFYDPTKRMICNYDGSFKRNMEIGEEEWIVSKCRYNPSQKEDPTELNGENDTIIQQMIELNNNPALRLAREKGVKQPRAAAQDT
jgi:hypothetical protein